MTKRIGFALAGLMAATALTGCNKAESKPVCDRDCLIKLTDTYVASLAKHSTDGVPLAADAAIVENVKPIKPGEGLWKDTTGPATQFQVHVPDPVRETAGWLGMMQVGGKPTMVAIRLKLDKDGKIAEAEHLYAEVRGPMLANVETVRRVLASEVPEAYGKSEAFLI
jgi:hypothetical protein